MRRVRSLIATAACVVGAATLASCGVPPPSYGVTFLGSNPLPTRSRVWASSDCNWGEKVIARIPGSYAARVVCWKDGYGNALVLDSVDLAWVDGGGAMFYVEFTGGHCRNVWVDSNYRTADIARCG